MELRKEGIPIPEASRFARKEECSVCGTVKRYFFNRVAAERGFTVVATGHNLDDEAARLLGNLLHWQKGHLERQHPLLPASAGGLVRKVKPLWRVSELETASYGFLKGIDYVTEECPMSVDATSLVYKEALSLVEEKMPGTRGAFYFGFLKGKALPRPVPGAADNEEFLPGGEGTAGGGEEEAGSGTARPCASCGAPTFTEVCAFCRLRERVRKGTAGAASRK